MKRTKYIFTVIQYLCILFVAGNILFAAHPLNTDDPFTVGNSVIQIEIPYEYSNDENIGEYTLPLTLTYGANDKIDMVVGLPFYHKTENGNFHG